MRNSYRERRDRNKSHFLCLHTLKKKLNKTRFCLGALVFMGAARPPDTRSYRQRGAVPIKDGAPGLTG
jgi:hypothetical protein